MIKICQFSTERKHVTFLRKIFLTPVQKKLQIFVFDFLLGILTNTTYKKEHPAEKQNVNVINL